VEQLTADEWRALREAVGAAGATSGGEGTVFAAAGGAASGTRSIRLYDFRVPDKFPKDVLRQVGHLFDGMARALTTSLSAQLRATVRVEAPQPEQSTYEEFIGGCHDPGILAAFAADPLSGSALLEVDPDVAYPMIDRMLGGAGEAGQRLNRPLTEIETTVIQRVLTTILTHWRDAWWSVAQMRPRILGVETNPLFVQLAAPGDIVLAVTLTCGFGRHEGRLRFCLPHTMLEPVLRRLSERDWSRRSEGEGDALPQPALTRQLARVVVPVRVEVGRTRLSLRALRALRPGDVLPLGVPPTALAWVHAADRPRFRGRIGVQGGRLAVEVASIEGE
jgi:flagellar motor switch protein FliM